MSLKSRDELDRYYYVDYYSYKYPHSGGAI